MDDALRTLILVAAYMAGATGLVLVVLRAVPAGRELVARTIGGQELWFAWAAAVLMTLSSLYLSEVLHYLPCRLCWFQRILAYPNVVVLGWAAFRRDRNGWAPALTLATLGIAVSTWHVLVDWDVISEGTSCDPNNPCTLRWQGFDGPLSTIQVGAFCCFLFIIGMGLHALARRPETLAPGTHESDITEPGTTEPVPTEAR